jgi:hypothetical protein
MDFFYRYHHRKQRALLLFIGLYFFLFCTLVSASGSSPDLYPFKPSPAGKALTSTHIIEEGAISLDGKLDESIWTESHVLKDFTQHAPDEGAPASEKTEVRVLYSKDSLYVGVRAFDSEASKIKSILARRDSKCPSDWIKIWIDSYHDRLTAFEFSVNPCGVKRDVHWSKDRRQDDNWDAVWDVEVSIDDEGWTAEFKIPFSQIRFPVKESHTWGFQAGRVIARKNETSYWRHIPKGGAQFVSLFGDLTGIEGIPSPKRLQLLPYGVMRGEYEPAVEGNPFKTGSDYLSNMGLDAKYGVSSNLTLDVTINPDFGQVEADPADVNLTAFETYFQEKRPFFIEGRDMLRFSLGSSIMERDSLFYSRRIGRRPQGYPSGAKYYSKPDFTTILGAFKLTGKTAGGWSIGIMEAVTSSENASVVTWGGEKTTQRVEPLANYFLGRADKEWRNGRSVFGFIFTAVNRNIQEERLEFMRNAAYSGGISFRHRWASDTLEMSGFLIQSYIRGSEEAILDAQESSARYYQRPDAEHLELDPARTSLSGYAGNFIIAKIGGGHWRWSLGARGFSPGFEVNDMGYMRDVDEIRPHARLAYYEYKPGKLFRDYNFSMTFWQSYDFAPTHLSTNISFRSSFSFLNFWNISVDVNRSMERLSTSQLRGGPAVLVPGSWRIGGSFRSNTQRDFHFSIRGSASLSDHGAKNYSLSGTLTARPSERLHLSLSPRYSDALRMLQYTSKEYSDSQTHYILSRINQKTVSLTLRLNYTITPNLSLQLYTQPYVSAGKYSEFKEVIEPRAEKYDDRWHIFTSEELVLKDGVYYLSPFSEPGEVFTFGDPDFNFRQFRLNFVLRWEYLPGSTLYLVWQNGINDYADFGELSIGDDLRQLFSSPSDNAFMLKISYWFNI